MIAGVLFLTVSGLAVAISVAFQSAAMVSLALIWKYWRGNVWMTAYRMDQLEAHLDLRESRMEFSIYGAKPRELNMEILLQNLAMSLDVATLEALLAKARKAAMARDAAEENREAEGLDDAEGKDDSEIEGGS